MRICARGLQELSHSFLKLPRHGRSSLYKASQALIAIDMRPRQTPDYCFSVLPRSGRPHTPSVGVLYLGRAYFEQPTDCLRHPSIHAASSDGSHYIDMPWHHHLNRWPWIGLGDLRSHSKQSGLGDRISKLRVPAAVYHDLPSRQARQTYE